MTAPLPRRLDVLALCALLIACKTPLQAQEAPVLVAPEARQALETMVKTYRGLKALDQETSFFGEAGGFLKIEKARLLYRKPNRLVLEVTQSSPGSAAQSQTSRFVCDGKHLYLHQAPQTYFRTEPAPKNAEGFLMLGVNLEMAALAGADPWEDFMRRSRSVTLEEGGQLDGEETDQVVFDLGAPKNKTFLRIHLGRKDRLIRRFEYTDEMLVPLKPDGEPEIKIPPVRYGYENRVNLKPEVGDNAFRWTAPAGVLELRSDLLFGRKGKRPTGPIYRVDSQGNAAQTRAMTYKDLVEEARRQAKRKP